VARVLVIDDDVHVRTVICRELRRAGHEPIEAENGRAGIEAVRREDPDLVITDLVMPEQEGIETIIELQSIDAQLPIIAISGSGGEGGFTPLDDAKMLGASVVIAKPFAVSDLMTTVKKLLAPRQP
jgi:CheY-like chemotaxis protein